MAAREHKELKGAERIASLGSLRSFAAKSQPIHAGAINALTAQHILALGNAQGFWQKNHIAL
ncbi:MAG: hypothetical protein KAU94_05555 [Verrucomicrobia bacterium]|nr:hypothetical protein [Verrucomicrobiota bacterium]